MIQERTNLKKQLQKKENKLKQFCVDLEELENEILNLENVKEREIETKQ